MYSWGRTCNDYHPKTARGFSFEDARRSYDRLPKARCIRKRHKREPTEPAAIRYTFRDGDLVTQSPYPLVVVIDTTGSMKRWPRIIFEKLPLLYGEAQRYFPECAISFQTVNDYFSDGPEACFQPAPFGEGPILDQILRELHPIGGGGPGFKESYEVAAAWNAIRLKTPSALIRPIVVFIGDEAPFETVPQQVADCLGLRSTSSQDAFGSLYERADVFLVRKPYLRERSRTDRAIVAAWRERALLSPERILTLTDPRRVVDVLLGILGVASGMHSDFVKELQGRQTRVQSRSVLGTLYSLFCTRTSGRSRDSLVLSIDRKLPDINETKDLMP